MADFNKVILLGNLTRDPIQRALPSGMMITNFGMAMNHRFRTQQGEDREDTCFVDVECYARTAENVVRYLRKGSQAMVEGRLRYDQWTDKKTGQPRATLRIVADTVQFMDRQPRPQAGDAYTQAGFGGVPQQNPGMSNPYSAQQNGFRAPGAAPVPPPVTPAFPTLEPLPAAPAQPSAGAPAAPAISGDNPSPVEDLPF